MGVKQRWLWVTLLGCFVYGRLLLWPAALAIVHAQTLPTATPDAEGVIYVIVQPNDSLWGIAGRAGIGLTELLDLNNLTEDALIQPGDRLIVAIVEPPASPTPEASPTPAATREPPTPTVTPPPGPVTAVCLVAFADENGNGEREPAEPLQAGVAFTIFTSEAVVANYVTDGISEPYCLTELEPGDYQITRSVGRAETLTNSGNRTVILAAGDQVMLGFGGLVGSTPQPTAVPTTQPANPIGSGAAEDVNIETLPDEENDAGRPFLIGAGILIGILLIGTAVLIGQKRR
ncbi:MAG: LysM peptidoglycan-binding domain-containing protein [Ardenticatenaceae bacterium]|nr:LysM peptidoglycan-binding domain-containing protein [Ardenticatenaceae bacterium]